MSRDHQAHPLLLDRLAIVRHQILGHRVAGHVLLHHVQVLRRLEAIDHSHDVWVVALDQALALARTMESPPPRALREQHLVEYLDGVHAAAVLLARLQHLALVALAEDLQQLVLGNVGDLRLLGLELEARLEGWALTEELEGVLRERAIHLGEHLG